MSTLIKITKQVQKKRIELKFFPAHRNDILIQRHCFYSLILGKAKISQINRALLHHVANTCQLARQQA